MPAAGPMKLFCGDNLRSEFKDEPAGCYSPRSMHAAKLLLNASRATIAKGCPASSSHVNFSRNILSSRACGRTKSVDDMVVPFKLSPPAPPNVDAYPSVAAAAAAAVQEAMATVLATRQCFVASPPQARRRPVASKTVAAVRARTQASPELQQNAMKLLASLEQHRKPAIARPQPVAAVPRQQHASAPAPAPVFGFHFGQATGALAPEKALVSNANCFNAHSYPEDGLAALALTATASERSSEGSTS
ncbi:hypothetical protein AB1Y20_004586 [Prymnesium parvum]|uniref:Uncharacterized protein n=1 Tax=Prymnesium parvum TaxID=97485 RepID=A0AB34IX66_PRYPA